MDQMAEIAFDARKAAYVQQIENSVLMSIGEDFRAARMEATFYKTHVKWMCTFAPASGALKTFRPQPAAQQAFLDMHELFGRMGQGIWSRAVFAMQGGQTKMHYFYEGNAEGHAPDPAPPPLKDADRSGAGPADPPAGP